MTVTGCHCAGNGLGCERSWRVLRPGPLWPVAGSFRWQLGKTGTWTLTPRPCHVRRCAGTKPVWSGTLQTSSPSQRPQSPRWSRAGGTSARPWSQAFTCALPGGGLRVSHHRPRLRAWLVTHAGRAVTVGRRPRAGGVQSCPCPLRCPLREGSAGRARGPPQTASRA